MRSMLQAWATIDTIITKLKENASKIEIPCTLIQYGSSVYLNQKNDRKPRDLDLCLIFDSTQFLTEDILKTIFIELGLPINAFFPDKQDLEDLRNNSIQQYGYYFEVNTFPVSMKICIHTILEYAHRESMLVRVYRRKTRKTLKRQGGYLRTHSNMLLEIQGDFREVRPGVIDSHTPGSLYLQGQVTYPYLHESFLHTQLIFSSSKKKLDFSNIERY